MAPAVFCISKSGEKPRFLEFRKTFIGKTNSRKKREFVFWLKSSKAAFGICRVRLRSCFRWPGENQCLAEALVGIQKFLRRGLIGDGGGEVLQIGKGVQRHLSEL